MNVTIHNEVPDGYYGKLADAWLKNDEKLKALYPVDESDIPAIQKQYAEFAEDKRELLVNALMQQYEGMEIHNNVRVNIEKLRQSNTYTVTTGQQVHIFLGPVFFIYKIASVIRQARRLQAKYPENYYIPVFWMATEDHDIAEINGLSVFGEKYTWETSQSGPAGRLSTVGLDTLCDKWIEMGERLNLSPEIGDVIRLFKEAYTRFNTLSGATRFIINQLFGKHGLLVIDPDNASLKAELQDLMRTDILSDAIFIALQTSSTNLKNLGYGNQVNPRKTHFFMVKDGQRLRIDRVEDGFKLHPTGEVFSSEKMNHLISEVPQLFSPNALMRPLYQQIILPNAAYVCGPAELHYWHQLYPAFSLGNVVPPLLLLRDSYLMLESRNLHFLQKNSFSESLLWKGYGSAAHYLESKLLGEVNIDKELEELKQQTETVFQSFFNLKYKHLRDLRESSNAWLKELEKAKKSAINDIRIQPALEPIFSKLQKIIQLYFDKKNPQEKSVSWVEILLKVNQNPIDLLTENTDSHHLFGTLNV